MSLQSSIPTVLALSQFFIENFPNISWYPNWYLGNPYYYLIGPVVPALLLGISRIGLISHISEAWPFGLGPTQIYLGLLGISWVVGAVGVYRFVTILCHPERSEGYNFGINPKHIFFADAQNDKKRVQNDKRAALISAAFFLLFPFSALLFTFSNGLYHFAWGFLPWVFVIFLQSITGPYPASLRGAVATKQSKTMSIAPLRVRLPRPFGARNDGMKKGLKTDLLLSILIAFVLLIDVSILLPLLVGFVCLVAVRGVDPPATLRVAMRAGEYQVLKTSLVLVLAFSLATIWYTPGFWLTLLQNPSFGGVPLANLGKFLFQLLLNLIPILVAVWVVKLRMKNLSRVTYFGLLFLLSFLFLTIIRYLSDPDFVKDWIGFLIEIQFGVAILLGHFASLRGAVATKQSQTTRLPRPFGARNDGVFVFLILLSILVSFWIVKNWMDSTNSDYQQRILGMLKDMPQEERVFLSGTPVFWANSYLNIAQVRGGVDQASIHPFWAHAAYQIREGTSSALAADWLKAMGASWVLVHVQGSEEPYRDFKHPEKFSQPNCHPERSEGSLANARTSNELRDSSASPQNDNCLFLVQDLEEDRLYQVAGVGIARVADESILEVKKPKDGADSKTLEAYAKTLKRPISLKRPGLLRLGVDADLKDGEVVSLAITYDPGWKIREVGKVRVLRDALGNIVVKPQKPGNVHLSLIYETPLWDRVVPGLMSLIMALLLINYGKFYPRVSKVLAKISHGLDEKDE